jgi:hypothetical protein
MFNLNSYYFFKSITINYSVCCRYVSSNITLSKGNNLDVTPKIKTIRNQAELPFYLDQVLIGICLGDGFLEKKWFTKFKCTI